jgi:hypothetical protein
LDCVIIVAQLVTLQLTYLYFSNAYVCACYV